MKFYVSKEGFTILIHEDDGFVNKKIIAVFLVKNGLIKLPFE